MKLLQWAAFATTALYAGAGDSGPESGRYSAATACPFRAI